MCAPGHRTIEGQIHLVFNDGVKNTLDFETWLDGPVFELLKDETYFRRFFFEGGTVTWPNGADIAPETLYERVECRSLTRRLSVVAVLSVVMWAAFSCISWAARKISGRPAKRGQSLILMLSALNVTGFVCLWILPKIT